MPHLDLLVILDRSGSMMHGRSDHEGGLRSFIEDQRALKDDTRFTLVQFDTTDPCEVVYDRVRLDEVGDVHLVPRGGTPLLDAVGKATAHLQSRQLTDPPTKGTVAMIITDGEENESLEWTKEKVQARVKELEGQNWRFLYLGANVDAFAEAGAVGIRGAKAMNYKADHVGIGEAYAALSINMTSARGMMTDNPSVTLSSSEVDAALDFSDEQRVAADQDDDKS